jgi:uncharacterized sulfatase
MAVAAPGAKQAASQAANRPNILWISLEDMSPDMGCYGDNYARTPVLDRFAASGVRFSSVFTHAPVCAPSRSGIITGMYPTTIGTHHMRCQGVPPPEVKCFTEYLRTAGYYCTNNSKTDYQFAAPFTAWDANSNQAHWRGRPGKQPFFSVFNFTVTHESQVRAPSAQTKRLVAELPAVDRHDPARAVLPPYYPDTPAVRRDWANYYDNITAAEKLVARLLKQLESDGLADDTIVWIWGDHGRGLPRGKRWVYDSGIQVPLLIRVPPKWRAWAFGERASDLGEGSACNDLIAFVDFAPTVLSLAGVALPDHLQGRAFLGPARGKPRKYIVAARDRMDERYDVIRAVRDERFKYIRNFMPARPYAQHIAYLELMPTMREWRRLADAGELTGPAALFFQPAKPVEELYDTLADPHEVNNLAGDARFAEKLQELRGLLLMWMVETNDLGLIPEPIMDEAKRPGGGWSTTAAPVAISVDHGDGESATIALDCPTAGASIGYRISDGDAGAGAWNLYHQPVRLGPGQMLVARACRIGFRDSPTVRLTTESQATPAVKETSSGADWRPQIIDESTQKRLLALKQHDRDPAAAIDFYAHTLGDKHPAIRYWAAVELLVASRERPRQADIVAQISRLAKDDESQAVRIAAAHVLCRWGSADLGLDVLAAGLDSAHASVQLSAACAIEDLGETARPLLPRLEQLAEKSSEYVQRVAASSVERLKAKQ